MIETKFVFLIPAYNCKENIKQTMLSMISQSYDNWRAVFIDDVSTDETADYIKKLAKQFGYDERINVVIRKEKFGEVRNTIAELKYIKDEEVVIRLDAGDWITENDCLYMLNEIYKEYDAAVCWTGQRWAYTTYGISSKLNLEPDQSIYDHPWVTSHLKTFRAKALKKVNEKNFFDDEGNWIMIACDQAVFLPMMHLALRDKKPLVYLPRTCYHYNIDLEKPDLFTEDRSLKQKYSAEWIRARGYVE